MEKNLFTDEQLISLHQHDQAGDGFTLIYRRHIQRIYQKCLLIMGNSEDARDVTQDVFLKVFEKPDAFHYRSSFSTWLHSVAHNKCVDMVRRRESIRSTILLDNLNEHYVDEWSEHNDIYRLKLNLLGQIPGKDLILLRLKYEQGLSIRELSQQFQLKECAVKMRLKRSRDRLKALYDDIQ